MIARQVLSMTDAFAAILRAVSGETREPIGRFRYNLLSDTWSWSESLYRMHGFEPGEIVPTTAVFVAHKHPADREHAVDALSAVLLTGQPFCCRHRIITTNRQVRTVVTIGQGSLDDSGTVVEVHGYFVDITDATEISREELQEAISRSAKTRADIEQAKGALMVVRNISAEDAFAVLLLHSQHSNTKLRDVATTITYGIQHPSTPSETPMQQISRLLSKVVAGHPAVSGPPVHGSLRSG